MSAAARLRTTEEVVLAQRNPRCSQNGAIVQQADRVPDLRAVCAHRDTASLLPVTKQALTSIILHNSTKSLNKHTIQHAESDIGKIKPMSSCGAV